MNKNRVRFFALAACCMAGGAMAQGYAGLGLGKARVNIDCSGTITCDKSATEAKLFGGYLFSPHLGLEAAYYKQGKLRETATDPTLGAVSAEWKARGFGVFGIATMPMDAWAVFAKLGIVNSKVQLDAVSATLGRASASERHTRFAWGLGGEYQFAQQWAGRLEFERIGLKFQDDKRNANLWSVGVVYRF